MSLNYENNRLPEKIPQKIPIDRKKLDNQSINRVDLVRFVDLGYQIFFLAFLGLGYVDTCYPSENGSSAGFPDP